MKITKHILAVAVMAIFTILPCLALEKVDSIRIAVERQINTYPASTLCDVYKNFFQDAFGPGHIIADSLSAANYLRMEMTEYDRSDYPLYEPTGYKGNFYRVSLDAVKDGIVPANTLMSALLRSAAIKPMPIDEWRREWSLVDSLIRTNDIPVRIRQEDICIINDALSGDSPAVHHSDEYIESYDPHYRIIAKEIFEKELKPLLDGKSSPTTILTEDNITKTINKPEQ